MSLLLIFSGGQGAAVAGLNLSTALGELLPTLQAEDYAQLEFWTQANLYEWLDEGAKRLARVAGGFVERDVSTTLVVGTHTYNLPARHLSTIHLSLGATALRPRTAQELEALDTAWVETASATVKAWIQDQIGTEQFRIYPSPATGAAGALNVILHRYPVEITASAAVIQAPLCAREYFMLYTLGEARGVEGQGAMPEVSAWCGEMTKLLEGVFRGYWGGAQ